MAAEDLDWERSKISNQDLNLMKKLGLMKKDDAIRFPSEESYPNPPMEYRVSFVDHLIRGLSAPIHDFLRGLLFVYGIKLHQTILLCLLFLPFPRMEKSKNKLSLPKTIKVPLFMKVKSQVLTNLRLPMKRKLNLKPASRRNPFLLLFPQRTKGKGMTPKLRHLQEADPSSQKAAYDPYLGTLISSDEEEEVPTADVAARTKADKAKSDAAGVEDLRKRLHDAETSLSEHITAQSAREEAILKRLKTQSRRFVARTAQEFQLEEPVNDPLLDALSFLEVHGSEAREGIDQAKAGLSRLFPYFFPKKEEPATFLDLAKSFNSAEDLGLKMRQENMKVAVESTVALVADSRQTIDWMKLIFDNYSSIPDPPEVFPSSLAKKSSVPVNLDDSSSMDLIEELKELRVQLQSVKKQSLILMEQSRESSEKEKIALQRAQDAISERDTAVAEADAAASRENSMLQLLTDASLDMADAFGNVIRRTYFNLSPSGETNITPAPAPSNLLDPSKFMVQVLDKWGSRVL
ncbi:hypothetical protein QYE76_065151 [Lolium multiflorum]|uniref:Uncharacterized protein n=1 Tax=Lolium multiflorum TaxID=4521 RepID=A0AAD8S7Y8_LOLMU|nr:hypothetical protein QYE76_065151 [Lolium multiflorum]